MRERMTITIGLTVMESDQTPWQPYREPVRTTLIRTGTIAAVIGAALVGRGGAWSRWPIATLLALWPALGGHWVELLFLNGLRPRLPRERIVQIIARLATWFAGGVALAACMRLTAELLNVPPARWSSSNQIWWVGGVGFIAVELIAHAGLAAFRRPNFYNGRG